MVDLLVLAEALPKGFGDGNVTRVQGGRSLSEQLVRTFWPRPRFWLLFRGTGSGGWLLTALP